VDSVGLNGYVGVCEQWWPYWLCRCMWIVVALLAMSVYVDSGGIIGYNVTIIHKHLHSH
jgi:hypothetical protein